VTYSYDADGNRQTRIDARGNLTTYLYDSRNLLTQRQYPDGTRATFTYNALGDRTTMANQTGRYTTTYDALRRKQTVVTPVEKVNGGHARQTGIDRHHFTSERRVLSKDFWSDSHSASLRRPLGSIK